MQKGPGEQHADRPVIGRLGHWMEQIIQEAQQRGEFDDLPGKGRPLHLPDSEPYGGIEAAFTAS